MTLRVRISVVPFGDETQEREIHQINVSNLRDWGLGFAEYGVEVDKYKTEDYDFNLMHMRQEGALELVAKVMEKIRDNEAP